MKYAYRKAQRPTQSDVYLWKNSHAINPGPHAVWFNVDPLYERISNGYIEVPNTLLILICIPLIGERS